MTTVDPMTDHKALKARAKAQKKLQEGGSPSLKGTLIKIAMLGLLDAGALFLAMMLIMKEEWGFTALLVAVTLIINYIYLRPGGLPANI